MLLRRAGLIDDALYLKLLNKTLNQVLQTPGRAVQSVAQASFDAWVKYYRQDENTPNATVSYYTKGALVALCFDLTLRQEGHSTLDAVLRRLWQRCQAGPLRQADFAAVLAELGARSFEAEIDAWVHGTAELPLASLLAGHGVDWQSEPAPLAQQLGLRASESQGVRITGVLRGSAAEQAGFAAGDEWLGIEQSQPDGTLPTGWRLRRLDELPAQVDPALALTALVARDQRLLRLRLAWPVSGLRCKLVVSDAERAQGWLSGRSV